MQSQTSFNPCFNGRCKRTNVSSSKFGRTKRVSILVLMEDVKERITLYGVWTTLPNVSILVLMEDVKELACRQY